MDLMTQAEGREGNLVVGFVQCGGCWFLFIYFATANTTLCHSELAIYRVYLLRAEVRLIVYHDVLRHR